MTSWLTLTCNIQSFYIENNAVTEGFVLTTFESNLDECANRCKKQKSCNAANFILSLNNNFYCMLIDTTRNETANKMPVADSVVYTLKSFCLEKPNFCANREWSFEKYPRYEPLNDHFVLKSISNITLQNCLNSCAEIQCEAAVYNRRNSNCRLSRVTLNNVNSIRQYFKRSHQIDLYENNCLKRQFDKRNCDFTRINQAGFVDVFDERLDNIRDQEECEAECLSWTNGHCRSYTYNKRTRHCYMSHASQKALGRSVLDSLSDELSSGELNDFELDCHGQSLTLTAKSLKLIKGTIKSKKGRDFLCEEKVADNYTFRVEFPFEKCGIERQKADDLTFAGLLMFKEGSTDLITIHDKLIEVKCKIHDQLHHQQDNQLSFHLEVEDSNVTTSLIDDRKTAKTPVKQAETFTKYRLDVLNSTGHLADVVDVGKYGYLLVTIQDAEESNPSDSFLPTELIAEDSVNIVKLIDSKGCVTETPLIKSIDRISPKKMKIKILFDGFPDQSQVTYQTLIKPCSVHQCNLECNSRFYVSNHTDKRIGGHAKFDRLNRRDLKKHRVTRQVTLAEEVYKIRAQSIQPKMENPERKFIELLTTKPPSWTNSKNLLQGKGNGNFVQCFTEDLSCMFSMLFAGLQVMLILFCSGIVYNFLSKWIRYYQTRNLHAADQHPSSFDDLHYDFGADTSQTSTSLNSTRLTSTTTGTQGLKK
ncbi:hypothetical protein M3Y96_00765300 [Aphelenchoides besseyi]|nr:hypothetical protein M3Y96_00765300 [Aphelenchoides besseyi]